ncbi:hypothetical protein DL771_001105 [Monosporascus sp. 5C6A]|nr:hypothetical protein DL771_001105 [Monosporascus sp. 5C6A]
MSYARSSRSDLDDRDYPSRRGPPRGYDDADRFDRREFRGSPRHAPAPVREYEDVGRDDRVPSFLREDHRKADSGQLVLRAREVETVDRRRPRSPSPQPLTRYVERPRSLSPPRRSVSRPRPRYIERSPSPSPQRERDVRVDIDSRIIERRRPRSPTPDRERDRIRIMMERERARSPSSSPSPPPPPPAPPVIKGPTIEREVITHYRDIDHGVERARPPSPPPPSRTPRPVTRERECETDIDIRRSRHEMDIDIRHSHRSRSRPRGQSRPPAHEDSDRLMVRSSDATRRRAHSEARPREEWDEEAEYITSKIDQRGRMGEAWNGATRDWTIVDVPPGTERVRMDGVGGGGAEVTWQRYNGVRRSKFLPERDGAPGSSGATTVSEPTREPTRDGLDRERERLSVQISSSRDRSRDREEVVEEVRDRHISIRDSSRAPPKRSREMWTEITKDLVIREAIEKRGYEYEETEYFFYVMEYLRYEDVVELVNMSDEIRRARRRRAREIEWEREHRDGWDRRHHHHHNRLSLNWDKMDDERIIEREVIYDRPSRTYMR